MIISPEKRGRGGFARPDVVSALSRDVVAQRPTNRAGTIGPRITLEFLAPPLFSAISRRQRIAPRCSRRRLADTFSSARHAAIYSALAGLSSRALIESMFLP